MLYSREIPIVRGRHKHRRVIDIIASPKKQTKEEYLRTLRQYYLDKIRPELDAIYLAILDGSDVWEWIDQDRSSTPLPDGWQWLPAKLPDYGSWSDPIEPAILYHYLLSHPKSKKPDIVAALGCQLVDIQRAFTWLREKEIIVVQGTWSADKSTTTFNLYAVKMVICDMDGNVSPIQNPAKLARVGTDTEEIVSRITES